MKIKSSYLIALQAILFILFLLITFFFNRFAADDYYFIGELKTKPFNEIYSNLYHNWNGRWTFNFLILFFLKLHALPFFLSLYNLTSIGILYFGIVRLINSLSNYYKIDLTNKNTFIYAAITLSIFFFCTIDANDTWLWYTSSVAYLWSISALIWGGSIFFNKKKRLTDYILFVSSAIYIGGSTEPLTISIILTLLFLIIKKRKVGLSIIGLGIITSSFLVNYFSPGTIYRDDLTPNLSIINLILYTGYGSIKFLLFSIHKTFIPALFLGLPIYFLGEKSNLSIRTNFTPLASFIKSLVLIISIVILNQLLVTYVLGGLVPERATISSSVVITVILIRYLFLLGTYSKNKIYNLKYVLGLNVIALICFNIYFYKVHSNYANAIDKRLENIEKSNHKPIKVIPLPYSGYIYSAEITSDTNNFKNQHLKSGLGSSSDIVLSK
ncbi:MAG: DUF6056 family protein [Vicingaceae bacterium]|nr:DUF6056 family protein [Vicingaceae bacterium]